MGLGDAARVLWASRRTASKGYRSPRHTHPWWQYLLVEHGSVLTMIEGKYALLTDEQAAMIAGDRPHSIYVTAEAQIIEVKFVVEDAWLDRELRAAQPGMGETNLAIAAAADALINEGVEQHPYYAEMANLRLQELLLQHLRRLGDGETKGSPSPTGAGVKHSALRRLDQGDANKAGRFQVAQIIEYMDEHLQEEITLKDLARSFGYTRSYLCQMFSQVIDVPPIRYLTLLRLERAKELVATSAFPVSQITVLTGFSSVHQLWRVCRSETGLSPTQFRKKHGDSQAADVHFLNREQRHVRIASVPFFW